jgi:uncharacterized SAM-binding protein YcdF (DUF218 family)
MKGHRRTWLRLVTGMLVATLAWVGGLFWFASLIPDRVVDQTTRADAIAVLTGDRDRLSTGLELLSRDQALKLFVSGVYHGVDVAKLLEMSRYSPAELQCCVEIGHSAGNTAGNAAETAAWMRRQDYRSLRLVTSNYHLPRSLMEFRAVLPDVAIVPHPVFHDRIKHDRWWAWPGTASLIISEYHKYLFAWLRQRIGWMRALEALA